MTRFYVVAEGAVEVMSEGAEDVAFRHRAGRHFGTAGLGHNGRSIALLRAATDEPKGTTIVAIPNHLHESIVTSTGLADDHIALLIAEASDG